MEFTIITDTREQTPLWSPSNTVRGTLKTGDYSIKGEENNVAIERKSLSDLFGTLGQGHARFKKELERALQMRFFAMVIEGTRTDVIKKAFAHSNKTRMAGTTIASILDTLAVKYGIHIYYCNGRREAQETVRGLLKAYHNLKEKGHYNES